VRVGPHQQLTRAGEVLQVDVVGDPVAGRRVPDAEPAAEALQVLVVLHVLVVDLQHVVVDVLDGERDSDVVNAEHLELHRGHGPGGVLDEDLVDREGQRGTGFQLARDEVVAEQLAGQVLRHAVQLLVSATPRCDPRHRLPDRGADPPGPHIGVHPDGRRGAAATVEQVSGPAGTRARRGDDGVQFDGG
jgi:hypothetical protein